MCNHFDLQPTQEILHVRRKPEGGRPMNSRVWREVTLSVKRQKAADSPPDRLRLDLDCLVYWRGRTWNPVKRTPVSSEVVSRAVFSMRARFSSLALSSYRTVPSFTSRMLGFRKECDRFSSTRDCKIANPANKPHARSTR